MGCLSPKAIQTSPKTVKNSIRHPCLHCQPYPILPEFGTLENLEFREILGILMTGSFQNIGNFENFGFSFDQYFCENRHFSKVQVYVQINF